MPWLKFVVSHGANFGTVTPSSFHGFALHQRTCLEIFGDILVGQILSPLSNAFGLSTGNGFGPPALVSVDASDFSTTSWGPNYSWNRAYAFYIPYNASTITSGAATDFANGVRSAYPFTLTVGAVHGIGGSTGIAADRGGFNVTITNPDTTTDTQVWSGVGTPMPSATNFVVVDTLPASAPGIQQEEARLEALGTTNFAATVLGGLSASAFITTFPSGTGRVEVTGFVS